MNKIFIIPLLIIIISCKNNEKEIIKKFYYPNQSEFSKNKNYKILSLKSYETFNQLVDSVENLNYYSKKGYLRIEKDNKEYNILISTNNGRCYPVLLKFKNILSISPDSIKKEKVYPITALKTLLKRDLLNFGNNIEYADSPEKLIVSITSELNELEGLIIKVIEVFNEIQQKSADSLSLNLFVNRAVEIYPPLPIN